MNHLGPKKNSYFIISTVICIVCLAAFSNCTYNKADELYPINNSPVGCASIAATFNANVLPIITSNCATINCHNTTAAGGVILQNYTQIFDVKDRINQRAIIEKTMPINAPLTNAEINIIKCWLDSGAPNN